MPISDLPVIVADDSDGLASKVEAYLEVAKQRASDGISLSEFSELTLSGLRVGIAAIDTLQVAGSEKKKIVVDIAGTIFDSLADLCIPAVARPVWWLVRPAARSLVLSLAAGAVESLLPLVRGK
jgi:hypothetical protein